MHTATNILSQLFYNTFGEHPSSIKPLKESGSYRQYFRIQSKKHYVLGAFNDDIKENNAFFSFTKSLAASGINVPEIYAVSEDKRHYLLTDLGDETLYQYFKKNKYSAKTLCEVKNAVIYLLDIQIKALPLIDFTQCYPRQSFDKRSVMWDLNYFKYNFLKVTKIPFNENALENDFEILTDVLMKAPSGYFMYRDFQSRNIMLYNDDLWFIDYQGGRKGPLQYDLASFLYSPKTGLNNSQREAFLNIYIEKLQSIQETDVQKFEEHFYLFALIRVLQALGAYGFRGLTEHKPGFSQNIPEAIENLDNLLNEKIGQNLFPEIRRIIDSLKKSHYSKRIETTNEKLTIRITSFSYKKGYPDDPSDNGGGFVFDCRGLPNPGRIEKYKAYSGLDPIIIDYLEQYNEVKYFKENAEKIVFPTIENYIERGFKHLCVSFGCTGGQHRSVYNAEILAKKIQNKYPVKVVLIHNEKQNWNVNGKQEKVQKEKL
ncbi:MAG: phosphotransferase [Prolixibacteraceae bacterium]|jgi:aminoglycoside/choline kinase family phosphotransferase|nr:phosphotransferase [Prolixibacteraceae bacterium]